MYIYACVVTSVARVTYIQLCARIHTCKDIHIYYYICKYFYIIIGPAYIYIGICPLYGQVVKPTKKRERKTKKITTKEAEQNAQGK